MTMGRMLEMFRVGACVLKCGGGDTAFRTLCYTEQAI